MNYYARFGSFGLCAVVLFVGLAHTLGWWSGEQKGLFQQVSRLLFEARRTEALTQRGEAVEEALVFKRATVAELCAGRLTLREAARRFADANNSIERDHPDMVPDYLKPATHEGVYLQVLSWARNETGDMYPDEAKKILEPLEKEFEELFGKSTRGPELWKCEGNEADAPKEEPPVCELLE